MTRNKVLRRRRVDLVEEGESLSRLMPRSRVLCAPVCVRLCLSISLSQVDLSLSLPLSLSLSPLLIKRRET